MNSKRVRKQSKFFRFINVPIRFLGRARDLYVKSLMGFGEPATFGNTMGCPTPHIPNVRRSFSVNSNHMSAEEELRDLVRLGSTRRFEKADLRRSKSVQSLRSRGMAVVPRSNTTVAFGRIDEDKIFEYDEENNDDVGSLLGRGVNYPRIRNYAA